MAKITAQFHQAVGKSVPGGPFRLGGVHEITQDTLDHPLIQHLVDTGKVVVLAQSKLNAGDSEPKTIKTAAKTINSIKNQPVTEAEPDE